MANLSLGDFARQKLYVPDVAPDLSGAQLLQQVSRQTSALANEAMTEWQNAEVGKASAAGGVAGQQENIKYRPGGTLTADAYNQSARKSLATMTELKSSIGMTELAQVYKNDPAMFQEKSAEFINTMTQGLRDAGEIEQANNFKAKMTLSAQTKGYEISKQFQAKQIDQIKADNEALLHTLKVNTSDGSGGLFSPDPEEQGIALTNFAVNKKLHDTSLHMVLPDGTPVYSAQAIQKRQQAFHTQFYTGAVQNWVSEADLSVDDMTRIKNGTLDIEIPGVGSINVKAEVGVEAYEKDIMNYTVAKVREKVAARAKAEAMEKEVMAQNSKANDIALLNNIYAGKPVSTTSIHKDVEAGRISLSAAKSALKMIYDPAPIQNDTAFVTDLKIKQIRGIDITDEVKSNTHRISESSYESLLIGAQKNQASMQSEDEKWIVREMVQKNNYGIEDPKSIRLAGDTVDSYRQKIKDGASPEKAFEEIRTNMDALKDRANMRAFNSVPKYTVITDGTINILGTAAATTAAFKERKIDEETYRIEMNRLHAINQRNKGVTTNGE